jgi:U3 small nucleolar RNA-associated protein 24
MGVAKKTRKFGAVKRIIGQRDARLQKNQDTGAANGKKKETDKEIVRAIPQVSSSLFFQYNSALVPPYSVLVDVSYSMSAYPGWCHCIGA